jgi:hypothetical protein
MSRELLCSVCPPNTSMPQHGPRGTLNRHMPALCTHPLTPFCVCSTNKNNNNNNNKHSLSPCPPNTDVALADSPRCWYLPIARSLACFLPSRLIPPTTHIHAPPIAPSPLSLPPFCHYVINFPISRLLDPAPTSSDPPAATPLRRLFAHPRALHTSQQHRPLSLWSLHLDSAVGTSRCPVAGAVVHQG